MTPRSISRGLPWLQSAALLLMMPALLMMPVPVARAQVTDSQAGDRPAADPWAFVSSQAASTDAVPSNMASPSADQTSGEDVPAETERPADNARAAALPDPASVDWRLLDSDPLSARAKPTHKAAGDASAAAWSRSDRPGATALSVKQQVLPLWDARIGADMNVASGATAVPLPEKFASEGRLWESSGVAWAAMTAPGLGALWDKTAIEAKVDPTQDQSRVGTSISKTLPLEGNATSLTLQGGYSRIEQTLLPGVGGRTVSTIEADRMAKFNFNTTGTSLIAGETLDATDKWLRRFGAEQKLLGDVTIAGAVTETSTGGLNKSLTAGFKKTW